jgi:hypothetical protein
LGGVLKTIYRNKKGEGYKQAVIQRAVALFALQNTSSEITALPTPVYQQST